MKIFCFPFKRFPASSVLKKLFVSTLLPLCVLPLSACSKRIDYFDSVSELRSNILIAKTETLSLRVFAVEKENPYNADGIKRETSPRTEIYLTAPDGKTDCNVFFSYDGKNYGGDMSFDNIKSEYYYACTLDLSAASELTFTIEQEEKRTELTATSVLENDTLPPRRILDKVVIAETENLKSMTDKNGFAGEIYIRLIYEESPYYYVGIINREGRIRALLVDSKTGKILAAREM